MRINLEKLFGPLPQPAPAKQKVQTTATDIVSKATLVQELNALPEGGYAILISIVPDEDGLAYKSYHFPQNKDSVTMHGLYSHAAGFLASIAHGQ